MLEGVLPHRLYRMYPLFCGALRADEKGVHLSNKKTQPQDFLRLCFALSVVALVVLIAAGVWSVLPVLAGVAVAVILSLGIVEAAKKRLL